MAPQTDHEVSFDEIESLFLGQLTGRRGDRVREHLRGCGQCDRAYERLASLDRALYRTGDELAPSSLRSVGARLFGEPTPPPRRAGWRSAVLGLAVAASAAVAVVTIAPSGQEDFRARGDGAPLSSQVSLRALRVRQGEDQGFEVRDAIEAPLRAGDEIKLLYSSSGHYRFVSVFLAGATVEELLHDVPLEDAVEQKLPGTVSVDETWSGPRRLIGVFHNGRAERPAADATPRDGPTSSVRVLHLEMGTAP